MYRLHLCPFDFTFEFTYMGHVKQSDKILFILCLNQLNEDSRSYCQNASLVFYIFVEQWDINRTTCVLL